MTKIDDNFVLRVWIRVFFFFFISCLVVLHFEVTEENEDVEVTEKNEVAAIERVSSPFLFTWKVIIQYVVNFKYG